MSQTKSATTVEQLVTETDHVQLSRLVTEHAWRADQGRADTILSAWVRITTGSFAPSRDGDFSRDVGSSCSREVTA